MKLKALSPLVASQARKTMNPCRVGRKLIDNPGLIKEQNKFLTISPQERRSIYKRYAGFSEHYHLRDNVNEITKQTWLSKKMYLVKKLVLRTASALETAKLRYF